jgi:hypothetical protein
MRLAMNHNINPAQLEQYEYIGILEKEIKRCRKIIDLQQMEIETKIREEIRVDSLLRDLVLAHCLRESDGMMKETHNQKSKSIIEAMQYLNFRKGAME